MNRNIFAYLMLLALFSTLLHLVTEMPFIMSLIVIAPMAMGVGAITIPPIYMLLKPAIADKNYEQGNVSIVVASVESIIVLAVFIYSNFDLEMLTANIGFTFVGISLLIDIIAFFREYYYKWIYISILLHIVAFLFVIGFYGRVDFFFIKIGLYYLLIHSIFAVSYGILRHVLRHRFPYVSNYKL